MTIICCFFIKLEISGNNNKNRNKQIVSLGRKKFEIKSNFFLNYAFVKLLCHF